MTDTSVGTSAAPGTSANPAPAQAAIATAAVSAELQNRMLGAYKQMLAYQFGGTLILAGGTALYVFALYGLNQKSPPLLALVMLAGMIGAFFSALTRLYDVDRASAALITPTVGQLGGWYLLMYSLVPPIVGAIAAVVLYLVFVGKLIEGPLFPSIGCVAEKSCGSILELMNNYWPKAPEDYGRALVWSFIAGFSERMVPNLLQGLVAKQEKGDGG